MKEWNNSYYSYMPPSLPPSPTPPPPPLLPSRVVFSDLRMSADYAANHPKCPTLLSTIIRKMVTGISALAPTEQMHREA